MHVNGKGKGIVILDNLFYRSNRPCNRNHLDSNGLPFKRYIKGGHCVECARLKTLTSEWKQRLKKYYRKNKKLWYTRSLEYRKTHREEFRQYQNKYAALGNRKKSGADKRYENSKKGKQTLQRYRSSEKGKHTSQQIQHIRRVRKQNQGYVPYTLEEKNGRFLLFDNKCAYCGNSGKICADHFIPIARGGLHRIENIIPACMFCNHSKNARLPEIWFKSQLFYSKRRWNKIVKVLGLRNNT